MNPRLNHRRTLLKIGSICSGFLLGCVSAGYGWYWNQYPYGWSHCCDKQLHLALLAYAELHDGRFPAGGPTPEASLSLLSRTSWPESSGKLADANLLRGKSIPQFVVEEILSRGELLGPDSCGWNYVEGLRDVGEDKRLAIFWDKAGLDHNGRRLGGGGHIVWFVNGDHVHIPKSDWSKFLEEQRALRAERDEAKEKRPEARRAGGVI